MPRESTDNMKTAT